MCRTQPVLIRIYLIHLYPLRIFCYSTLKIWPPATGIGPSYQFQLLVTFSLDLLRCWSLEFYWVSSPNSFCTLSTIYCFGVISLFSEEPMCSCWWRVRAWSKYHEDVHAESMVSSCFLSVPHPLWLFHDQKWSWSGADDDLETRTMLFFEYLYL